MRNTLLVTSLAALLAACGGSSLDLTPDAGDGPDAGALPGDADGDGIKDDEDDDADGNGLSNDAEGDADTDGDGIPDWRDLDDDGDNLRDSQEIGEDPSRPMDTDGDGIPDYRDTDSDNDTIGDIHELLADPDKDGIPAFRDIDSDDDCVLDALEAGDADEATIPVDTDSDSRRDFLDLDSDDDGIPDKTEDADCDGLLGADESSRILADTDNDGVSDLVEVAAGTGVQDPTDNPRANGDFVFLEPFMDAPSPADDRLDFATAVRNVDLYFLIDTSGSMFAEAASIRDSITEVVQGLVCAPGDDPVTTGCIESLQTGVARYGYNNPHTLAEPMQQLKPINGINLTSQGSPSTQSVLPVPANSSAGGDEWHLTASWFATEGTCATDATRLGRACFRDDSLRVIAIVTDEDFNQDDQWASANKTLKNKYLNELANRDIRVIGVHSESNQKGDLVNQLASQLLGGMPQRNLTPLLTTTNIGTPACNALAGNPFHMMRAVLAGDGAQAAKALTCAVQAVTRFVEQDVRAEVINVAPNLDAQGNSVDAPSAFVDHIEVFMDGSMSCPMHPGTQDSDGDGKADVYTGLIPGTNVCWKVLREGKRHRRASRGAADVHRRGEGHGQRRKSPRRTHDFLPRPARVRGTRHRLIAPCMNVKDAIVELVGERGPDKTVCPSEVARKLDPANWRSLMDEVRAAAAELEAAGDIEVTQGGKVVALSGARGPIRLRQK